MSNKRKILGCLAECVEFAVKIAQPALVVGATCLIAVVVFIYFAHIVPYSELSLLSTRGIVQTGVGIYILFAIYFNYFACVFTSPGSTNGLDELKDIEEGIPLLENGSAPGITKHCKKCDLPKPERSHHCHICKRCVLRMDHHCPWVANCVGFGNYRYFFLFLFYLWIGCAYVMVVTTPALASAHPRTIFDDGNDRGSGMTLPPAMQLRQKLVHQSSPMLFRLLAANVRNPHHGPCLFAVVLCLSIFMAMIAMMGFHLYLVCSGQTTIEFHGNRKKKREARMQGYIWKNPYYFGKLVNFQLIFGVVNHPYWWIMWLVPVLPRKTPEGKYIRSRKAFDFCLPSGELPEHSKNIL